MAKWLKQAISKQDKDEAQQQVRETVEKLLADIETHGDTAVRELSKRFDNWEPVPSCRTVLTVLVPPYLHGFQYQPAVSQRSP